MSAATPSRYFDDLVVGETRRSRTVTIDGAEMLAFAQAYDPQWFHADADAARDSAFGGLIGSGIYSAAVWRRLDHEINGDVAFVCGVAWEQVRWAAPLRAGDAVYVTSSIRSLRPSGSEPSRGVAVYACALTRTDGTDILTFDSINLIYRRQYA